MTILRIYFLAALVISGLGGFFFYRYGITNYNAGYNKCIGDGAVLATEAAEVLKNEIRKIYTPNDVINKLRINNWLRNENDI